MHCRHIHNLETVRRSSDKTARAKLPNQLDFLLVCVAVLVTTTTDGSRPGLSVLATTGNTYHITMLSLSRQTVNRAFRRAALRRAPLRRYQTQKNRSQSRSQTLKFPHPHPPLLLHRYPVLQTQKRSQTLKLLQPQHLSTALLVHPQQRKPPMLPMATASLPYKN